MHYKDEPGGETFFTTVGKLEFATIDDFLDELRERKRSPGHDVATVASDIYDELKATVTKNDDWRKVSTQFETGSLVFFGGKWYPPSMCLWSSPVAIDGRVVLNSSYPDLYHFFVNGLGVKEMEVGILVQDLINKVKHRTSLSLRQVKGLLITIAEMLRNESEFDTADEKFEALKAQSFLPVKGASGKQYLTDVQSDFAILDHLDYAEAFGSSILALDFSESEVVQLHPLLQRLGLDDKCLSNLVEEKSIPGSNSALDEFLTAEFRTRAYAFSWYVGPFIASFHWLLKIFSC